MKNLLITGYRAHELGVYSNKHKGIPYIIKAIESRLIPFLEDGLEWVLTPGQYGVDLWAIEAAIRLKSRYPQLKCSIVTAYSHPEEQWNEEKKTYFQGLIRQVDFYTSVSKKGYEGSWQFKARDELLLRKSDGILLVYDEENGEASPRFIKEQAMRQHLESGYGYVNIGHEEIQAAVEDDQPWE
ncbi:DUF1273 family protein [Paenibacillus sp. F411]|uniref:SLOG family protein n=1 Tax=unclassified Paenibacillus TaxID=185978 RepID=UPI001AAE8690|nr:SLOG family protein [Paenibacillus sp. F411]MBO2944037.1 DUF1273 family protein [Paenibacillus sp. F411]